MGDDAKDDMVKFKYHQQVVMNMKSAIHEFRTYRIFKGTYIHTYIHSYIPAYIHTDIHTYIHIHTYIDSYCILTPHFCIHTYIHTYRSCASTSSAVLFVGFQAI